MSRPVDLPAPHSRPVPALAPAVAVPPLLVGGRSDAALRRTVRHGADWLGIWASPDRVRRTRDRLGELADAAGARRPSVVLDLFVAPGGTDADRAEAGEFLARTYGADAATAMDRYLLDGGPAQVADALARLRTAGVDGFVLTPAARDLLRALDHLGAVVAGAAAWPCARVERVGPALVMTLDRPQARNAIDAAVSAALGTALERLDADPALRVGVLTGAGPAFCAGADLKAVAAGRPLHDPEHRGAGPGRVRAPPRRHPADRRRERRGAGRGDRAGAGLATSSSWPMTRCSGCPNPAAD